MELKLDFTPEECLLLATLCRQEAGRQFDAASRTSSVEDYKKVFATGEHFKALANQFWNTWEE